MIFKKFFFIILISFFILGCAVNDKKLYRMDIKNIDRMLYETKGSVKEKIEIFNNLSIGTKYKSDPLGESRVAYYDKDPLINLRKVDCMTYVEQILALSLSESYEGALGILSKIRYKNGMIGFKNRNHYVVTDWLIANKWIVDDITKKIAGNLTEKMTKIISRKGFFHNLNYDKLGEDEKDIEYTTDFIPLKYIEEVEIPSSSIIIFFQDRPGIFAKHMGFIIKKGHDLFLYHASSMAKKVEAVLLYDYVKNYSKATVGFKIIKVNGQT